VFVPCASDGALLCQGHLETWVFLLALLPMATVQQTKSAGSKAQLCLSARSVLSEVLGIAFLQVRTATTAEPIAHAILELEALLRPTVFTSVWGPSSQVQPRPAGAPARKGPAGRKPTLKPGMALATAVSKSGRLNRAASAASGETNGFPAM